jgi:tRNA pseudouridine55 synthase
MGVGAAPLLACAVRVLCLDKPLGPSSHDVVVGVRRALGERRVGHAGTLDPLATGVLVVLVGEATKLSPFLIGSDKSYLAWITFGVGTATLDAEGPVTERGDPGGIRADDVAAALPPFLVLETQVPPRFSAVQRAGVRSYAEARRGRDDELPPRPAGYLAVELLAFAHDVSALPRRFAPAAAGWRPAADGRAFPRPPELEPGPTALVSLRVRAGTYARAFARDLGAALGVPAHLSGLVRTRAGGADLSDAVPPEGVAAAAGLDPVALLPFPRVRLDAVQARRIRDGQRIDATWTGRVVLIDPDGALVAVADAEEGRARSLRVWRKSA